MSSRLRRRSGQSMTEYIIIVALIAIAAIGVISLFGDDIRIIMAGESDALAGTEDKKIKTQEAHQDHWDHKSLSTFGQKNYGTH